MLQTKVVREVETVEQTVQQTARTELGSITVLQAPELEDNDGKAELTSPHGAVTFENVGRAYDDSGRPAAHPPALRVGGCRSEETVRAALRDADALEFFERLPQGLDTVVGERGPSLSGGQRLGVPPAPQGAGGARPSRVP